MTQSNKQGFTDIERDRWLSIRLSLSLVILSVLLVSPLRADAQASFLYNLSNFTGPIPYSPPKISVDARMKEVSVLYGNSISIFSESGMEIYRFGDDLSIGAIVDLTSDGEGNILLLSFLSKTSSTTYSFVITRCNYRGESLGRIELSGLPSELAGFAPQRLISRGGKIYLGDMMGLKVLVATGQGRFERFYDLFVALGLKEKDRGNVEIWGFNVNDDGSILFTVPVLYSAHRLYPDGRLVSFGKPGGAPGRFNIVGGIVQDSRGNYLVVDKLKYTVMIFDQDQKYLSQFGFKGNRPGNLIAPDQITIDGDDRVYVTQNGRRGVSVFKVAND
jgi:hypothetical protein